MSFPFGSDKKNNLMQSAIQNQRQNCNKFQKKTIQSSSTNKKITFDFDTKFLFVFPIDSIDQLLDHDQQRSNIFVQGNVSLENSIVPNSIIIDSK